jgi:transcriptional regulator with XRE-family HTH domain
MPPHAKFAVMEESRRALGRVIRELREAQTPRLSQEELGRRAGYRTGAGVSMSRIENGVTRPTAKRLEGIAAALGLGVSDLQTRAGERTGTEPAMDTEGVVGDREESTTERLRRIQAEFERRHTTAMTEAGAFNAAHDRARDEFFLPFMATARSISGLPVATARSATTSTTTSATTSTSTTTLGGTEAQLRRELAARGIAATLTSLAQAGDQPADPAPTAYGDRAEDSAADREAAYNAVVATAILSAGPGPAGPEQSTGATARATRALLGGSRPVGGPRLAVGAMLTGLVATAASPLFAATTLVWLARRNRRQNEQLRRELDQAEADLGATDRGFTAVMVVLARATERLDYIAVHGGHAQRRWTAQLPPPPTTWSDLRPDQQSQFGGFIELAACQVCVDTIDMTELLAATGPQQDALLEVADDLLTLTQQDVERLV